MNNSPINSTKNSTMAEELADATSLKVCTPGSSNLCGCLVYLDLAKKITKCQKQ